MTHRAIRYRVVVSFSLFLKSLFIALLLINMLPKQFISGLVSHHFVQVLAGSAIATLSSLLLTDPALAQALRGLPFEGQQTLCVARLTSQDANAQINLRAGAGTNQRLVGYGVPGDLVYVLGRRPPEPDFAKDSQGKTWQRVGFPSSRIMGWIREDFLVKYCTGND